MKLITNDDRGKLYYMQRRCSGLVKHTQIVKLLIIQVGGQAVFKRDQNGSISVRNPNANSQLVCGRVYEKWDDHNVEVIIDEISEHTFSEL